MEKGAVKVKVIDKFGLNLNFTFPFTIGSV